jgi:hypothetical protein
MITAYFTLVQLSLEHPRTKKKQLSIYYILLHPYNSFFCAGLTAV